MKIKIDYTRINNAPCEIPEEEDIEFVSELSQRLQNGCNSCFLVSGYRGSGKTSLIYKIKENLKKYKDTLIIDINLVKYEEIPIILRKLIRGMFFKTPVSDSFNGFKLMKRDWHKKNAAVFNKQAHNRFVQYFNLLYLRTFNDVTLSANYLKKFELSTISDFTLENFKIIMFWIFSVLLALFVNLAGASIQSLSTLFAAIMSILVVVNLSISFSKSKSKEINIKSLYDSDVAENQITEILKGFKERGYKIIFVLDEMDKIEKQSDLEKLITQLKPLMLNGMASFIIVSGQKLYYKYLNEDTAEDSLIFNIFTGLVHVPLKSDASFKKVFSTLLQDKSDADNETVRLYIESLILNSNRTMRTFLNLISKNITWDRDGNAMLCIDEDNEKIYRTDSLFLAIIARIRDEIIVKFDYDKCITDYFTIQLHRWIKKIKQKSIYRFKQEEIFGQGDIDASLFWLKSDLDFMFTQFLKEMKDSNFIEEFYDDGTKYYQNAENAEIEIEDSKKVIKSSERKVLNIFSDIEKLLGEIYSGWSVVDGADISIPDIIEVLVSDGVIDQVLEEKLDETRRIVSKIKPFDHSAAPPVDINNRLIDLKHQLIFNYTYHVIKSHDKSVSDLGGWHQNTNIIFEAGNDENKTLFYYVYFEKIAVINFSFILDEITNVTCKYKKSVLLIAVQDISAQDMQQIILDCNIKGIIIIFCYANGKLKTRKSIIKYLNK